MLRRWFNGILLYQNSILLVIKNCNKNKNNSIPINIRMFVEKKFTLPNHVNLDIKCTVSVDQQNTGSQGK